MDVSKTRLQVLAQGDLTERAQRRAQEISRDADLKTQVPHGWAPRAGRGSDPAVSVAVAEDDVVTLVSRGLSRTDAAATLHVTAGDPELGRAVTDGMAAAMSAYYVEL